MEEKLLQKPFDRLLFVITLILVFTMAARAPVDSDMWWALRAGQETWVQKAPYTVDSISYTFGGSYWNSHSWLFDLILYGVYAGMQYYGLTLLVGLLAAGAMALFWRQLRGPALFRALMVIFASTVVSPLWTPRPQMVSMLLLSFTCLILLSYKQQKHDWLLCLPPVMILWANLHAGYTLGLMAIGLLIAGELLDRFLFNNTENALQWFQIRKLILVGIACGLAALLTPHGFGTWQIAFSTLGMKVNDLIYEWKSPDFHQAFLLPYLFSVLLLLFSLGWSKKRLDGWSIATAIWFTYFAFVSQRQIGPYVFTVLPILGRSLWEQVEEWYIQVTHWWKQKLEEKPKPRLQRFFAGHQQTTRENKALNLFLTGLLALLAAGKLVYVSHPLLMESVYIPSEYPSRAVEWIKSNKPAGNLFNDYGQGGYLSWFLQEYPVYIDARADLYGDDFLLEWVDVVTGNTVVWNEIAENRNIGVVLISSKTALAKTLENSPDWSVAMDDNQYRLFVRQTK